MATRGAQTRARSAKGIDTRTGGATMTKTSPGVGKTRTAGNGVLATTTATRRGTGGTDGPRRRAETRENQITARKCGRLTRPGRNAHADRTDCRRKRSTDSSTMSPPPRRRRFPSTRHRLRLQKIKRSDRSFTNRGEATTTTSGTADCTAATFLGTVEQPAERCSDSTRACALRGRLPTLVEALRLRLLIASR